MQTARPRESITTGSAEKECHTNRPASPSPGATGTARSWNGYNLAIGSYETERMALEDQVEPFLDFTYRD